MYTLFFPHIVDLLLLIKLLISQYLIKKKENLNKHHFFSLSYARKIRSLQLFFVH